MNTAAAVNGPAAQRFPLLTRTFVFRATMNYSFKIRAGRGMRTRTRLILGRRPLIHPGMRSLSVVLTR
jgi:hypothetical protein